MSAELEKTLFEDLQVLVEVADRNHVGPSMDRFLEAVRASLRGSSSGVGTLAAVMRRMDAGGSRHPVEPNH